MEGPSGATGAFLAVVNASEGALLARLCILHFV